jgi:transcriptional regulator with XRE-family HTH domain
MDLHPAQCRAARGLLEWSQGRLAKAAGLGMSTVRDFEKGRKTPLPKNLAAIRAVLEIAGVQFINPGKGGGPGVRLKLNGP